jgi:hypothetical protein
MSKTDDLLGRLADAKAMLTALRCEFEGYDEIAAIVKEHGKRENGCEWCNTNNPNFEVGTALPKTPCCPRCGRKLEVDK